MKLPHFFCILMVMATAATQTASNPVETLARETRASHALDWIGKNLDWIEERHVRLTEIPAPPYHEAERGAYVRKLFAASGLKVRTDELGNVIGERSGADNRNVVLLSAHLDTVFPPGIEVRVRREGGRLLGPGISDNGSGLAALVGMAQALHEAKLRTGLTVIFAANVGEEGEGNLRGMRKLVQTYRGRLRAVIVLDGASAEHVTTMALASRRVGVTIQGPGGHSWSDFGMPNPIHALARGVARFVKVRVPDEPRTTFNVGEIEGGTSVNSVPFRASIKVDLRSESETELDRLEASLREAIQAGIEDEMAASRARPYAGRDSSDKLEVKFRSLGVRPGGELPADSPLFDAIRNVDRYLGNRSRLERSSTDANIPLSLGIPAISLGGGGQGGAAHSLSEWYDPSGRELGLQRVLLTLLAVAGVEP